MSSQDGDGHRSTENYDKAIEINSHCAKAYLNKWICLANTEGRQHEALLCYDKAIGVDPRDAASYLNKAACLDEIACPGDLFGWRKLALECYDKAIEISPQNVEAYFHKGVCLEKISGQEVAHQGAATKLSRLLLRMLIHMWPKPYVLQNLIVMKRFWNAAKTRYRLIRNVVMHTLTHP